MFIFYNCRSQRIKKPVLQRRFYPPPPLQKLVSETKSTNMNRHSLKPLWVLVAHEKTEWTTKRRLGFSGGPWPLPCSSILSWPEWSRAWQSPWCCASRQFPKQHQAGGDHSKWRGKPQNTPSSPPAGTTATVLLPVQCLWTLKRTAWHPERQKTHECHRDKPRLSDGRTSLGKGHQCIKAWVYWLNRKQDFCQARS